MTSPMPRDSLGRIGYVGDVTTGGSMVYLAKSPYTRMMSQGSFFNAAPVKLTVDLTASPDRTNYERYFADLGTHEEVARSMPHGDECLDGACDSCPFDYWGKAFSMPCDYCVAFDDWLNEKAVI